jgi:hypothetical protein
MKRRLAELTSNILNPFLLSFVLIVLLSFKSTASTLEAIKWSLISIGLSILPVFIVIIYLVRNQKLDSIFINFRKQRTKIYLLSGAWIALGCLVLFFMGAPTVFVAIFIAGLVMALIFMAINLMWKISIHTAFASASITILIIVYGATGVLTALLLPPVAWSRIEMKLHSPAQVVGGALVSAVITIVVFQVFGLIGAHV